MSNGGDTPNSFRQQLQATNQRLAMLERALTQKARQSEVNTLDKYVDQLLDGELDPLVAKRLRLTSTGDASPISTNHALQIGSDDDYNLIFDNNEIMARNNGGPATLGLNVGGGAVSVGSGGMRFSGDEDRMELTIHPDAVEYATGSRPVLSRWGRVVNISGAVKPADETSVNNINDSTGITLVTFDPKHGPRNIYGGYSIQQGSGENKWLLSVTSNSIRASRYGPGQPDTGNWLPFSVTYIANPV